MNGTILFEGVVRAITSSLDIGVALDQALRFIRIQLPVDVLSLFYYDFNRECLFCLAEADVNGAKSMLENPVNYGALAPFHSAMGNGRNPLDQFGFPEVDIPTQEETGWYLDNNPMMRQRYSPYSAGSILRVWLHINENMTGTLMVISKNQDVFTDSVIEAFKLVRDPLTLAMSNARRFHELMMLKSRLEDENRTMRQEMIRETGLNPVGGDFGLKDVLNMARQVANMPSPVLLLGETGTGKEVIANAIHLFSDRRDKPMIKVQCGAIPDSLLDSELFGHERGAFTGAINSLRGRFERAEGGTLFLDEIGELTMEAQIKMLRVLQERKIERLGGDRTIDVNVRIIAATNRNLAQMVQVGRFREDLWFRLNVFPIHLPPLRYRKEDIPALVTYFVQKKSNELNLQFQPLIRHSTLRLLIGYDWPGNVRELQNVIERALILQPGPYLEIPESLIQSDSDRSMWKDQVESGLKTDNEFPSLDAVQTEHIRKVLVFCDGRVSGPSGAAQILGINPNTLRARMRKLGIEFGVKKFSVNRTAND